MSSLDAALLAFSTEQRCIHLCRQSSTEPSCPEHLACKSLLVSTHGYATTQSCRCCSCSPGQCSNCGQICTTQTNLWPHHQLWRQPSSTRHLCANQLLTSPGILAPLQTGSVYSHSTCAGWQHPLCPLCVLCAVGCCDVVHLICRRGRRSQNSFRRIADQQHTLLHRIYHLHITSHMHAVSCMLTLTVLSSAVSCHPDWTCRGKHAGLLRSLGTQWADPCRLLQMRGKPSASWCKFPSVPAYRCLAEDLRPHVLEDAPAGCPVHLRGHNPVAQVHIERPAKSMHPPS